MIKSMRLSKSFSLAIAIVIFASLTSFVLAQTSASTTTSKTTSTQAISQTATSSDISKMINEDENVQPQDLGVSKVGILPNSPFYFFKNWWRGLRLGFTFNPVKKLELQERFANEKLFELKKLAEEKQNPKILDKAVDNYQKEMNKVKNRAERLKVNP